MTAATMISSHYDSSEEEEEQNQDQLDEHVARIAIPSPVSSSFQTDPANDRSTTSSSRSHAADDIPTSSSASSSSYSTSNPASLTDSPPASSPLHCSTCGASPPRYCCPGCSTSSCSLACVTSHKARTGCTGKRPRTSYVPLAQFTAGQLQHDLFFLEEVSREAGKTMRHPLLQKAAMHVREKGAEDEGAGIVSAFAGGAVGGRSVALQRECMRRGIKVMVMPEGMKRHQINSSGYQARTGELSWHVEWLLDAHALTMHQHRSARRSSDWSTWCWSSTADLALRVCCCTVLCQRRWIAHVARCTHQRPQPLPCSPSQRPSFAPHASPRQRCCYAGTHPRSAGALL